MQSDTPALQLTLATNQVLTVTLNLHTVTDRKRLDIAAAQALAKQRAEIENRTYHMGKKATASLDYDDQLPMRLKCSVTSTYAYYKLTGKARRPSTPSTQ